MKRVGLWLALLLPIFVSVSSCTAYDRFRKQNERLYLIERLSDLEEMALPMPSPECLWTPYPVLTKKDAVAEAETLLGAAIRLELKPEIIRFARLLGRGAVILHYADPSDSLLLSEGFLLSGNALEALRLLRGHRTSALYPFAEMSAGKPEVAFSSALSLLKSKQNVSPGERLRLARLVAQIHPEDSRLWSLEADYSLSVAERQYATLRAALAVNGNSTATVDDAIKTVLSGSLPGRWSKDLALLLLPVLLDEEKYPELWDVWQLLPEDERNQYPYSMLPSLSSEIETIRAYERDDAPLSPQSDEMNGSFRDRYGDVTLAPNWGMTYSKGEAAPVSGSKPSEALYQEIKKRLRLFLVPL